MNKEQLANLKDFVANRFPNRLTSGHYYSKDEECNCIVGAMFSIELGEDEKREYGSGNWFNKFHLNPQLIDVRDKFINHFGMTDDEVHSLQVANDSYMAGSGYGFDDDDEGYRSPEGRSVHVKNWLIGFIEKKERELG